MGQKITISELAIKVRLDSKSATKGLKKLERQLKTFQHYIKTQLNTERAKTTALHQQINAQGRSLSLQGKMNKKAKEGLRIAKKTAAAASFMKNILMASMVMRVVGGIRDVVKDITAAGMGVNLSLASLGAAVGASAPAEGMSRPEVEQMTERQRTFALNTAKKYGQNVAGGTLQYAKFFAAASGNIGEQGVMNMYTALSKLGVVYGMSGEKMERAMTAFTQMASKNQVMAEELKQQLGDVLPGAMEIFARALTKTSKFGTVDVKKLYELMEDGKIIASEVFDAISAEMSRMAEANGALQKAMNTTAAKWNVMKSTATIFKTSALNQFSARLGEIIDKITKLLAGKGLASALGILIHKGLGTFAMRFDVLFTEIEKFEQKFSDAIGNKAKLAVINEYFSEGSPLFQAAKDILWKLGEDVAAFFGKAISGALNALTVDNLQGFIATMIEVVSMIFKGVAKGLTVGTDYVPVGEGLWKWLKAEGGEATILDILGGVKGHVEKGEDLTKDQMTSYILSRPKPAIDQFGFKVENIAININGDANPEQIAGEIGASLEQTTRTMLTNTP